MLTERQSLILTLVVETFVATAEPVGSRQLAKRTGLDVSPATIRNEMADLEELGFLEQPHTSAGRVPTDRGYRYYVDHLRLQGPVDQDRSLLVDLEHQYLDKCHEVRGLLTNAVRVLSDVSQLTGLAVSPSAGDGDIRKVQLVGVDGSRILMVVVSASGHIGNHMLSVDAPVPQHVLNRLSDIINENFSQASMRRLLADELVVLRELETKYRATVGSLLGHLSERLARVATEERLYLEGIGHILEQPEFRNFEKARLVVDRFVTQSDLGGLLRGERSEGTQVTIGAENSVAGLEDFAVISSPFRGPSGNGAIGVIGPRRMQYARVMALVGWVSRRLSEILAPER